MVFASRESSVETSHGARLGVSPCVVVLAGGTGDFPSEIQARLAPARRNAAPEHSRSCSAIRDCRSTYRATKLRKSQRTEGSENGLNKPQTTERTSLGRYRTQEVAGSSPTSSIR
jgi:hypothetical protein